MLETLIGLLPTAFSGAKAIADAIGSFTGTSRTRAAVDFAEEIVAFIVKAEQDGLSEEAILQGVGDIYVDLVQKLKTGVR